MADKRVVVVGTTADYIEIISERFPGRALFVTDVCERTSWQGLPPDPSSEVVCRLGRPDEVLRELEAHLLRWSIQAVGVACFDCESLMLASLLAAALALPFPTAGEVASCRSKYAAKDLWWASGVSCPAAGLVRTPGEAVDFWRRVS
ncbi:MAG: hypothetical protein JSV66_17860 [Trueperaceae bacterium]|nr:MAG: hypothetical protein JSV66_17860 [Trueperaceae bacterium]